MIGGEEYDGQDEVSTVDDPCGPGYSNHPWTPELQAIYGDPVEMDADNGGEEYDEEFDEDYDEEYDEDYDEGYDEEYDEGRKVVRDANGDVEMEDC